jgi:NAD-dependent SIR2 family protein deacetylase
MVKALMKQQEVLLITGAGVSAASGIPTFRGQGGLYDKLFEWEGQSYQPE